MTASIAIRGGSVLRCSGVAALAGTRSAHPPVPRVATPQRTRDNGPMTRSELIHRIAQKQSQIIERDVELAVKMMLEQMTSSLAGGGRIEIRAFGSFSLRLRPARVARNPRTGTPVSLPARSAPHFKPGKRLRECVNRENRGVADDTDGAGIIAIRDSGASFSPQKRRR